MSVRLSGTRIWAIPTALGLLTVVGVTAALLFDGLGDAISWLTLAVPVATALWHTGKALAPEA